MMMKSMYFRISLLLIFLSASLFTFAQTKNNDKELLQGKWVLESVAAHDPNKPEPLQIEDLNIEIYSEIEIKNDVATLISKQNTLKGKYKIDNSYLNFDLPATSFVVEWGIVENELHLLQRIEEPTETSGMILVSSIYKRN